MNQRHRGGGKETAINLPFEEYVEKENEQLQRFHRDVDDYLDMAGQTMSKLKDQRDVLIKGKSALRNIVNQLGMSNTVMRLIEKRSRSDWIIFWCLAFIFLLFVLLMIYIYR